MHAARAAPVDLGALARFKLQGQKRLLLLRPDAPDMILEDRVATRVALFPELVEELHRGERMGVQPARHRRLEGIQLARPRTRCRRAAHEAFAIHPQPDGLHMQLQLEGDLRRRAPLAVQLFDPAEGVVVDHDATSTPGARPPVCMDGSSPST